MMLPFKELVKKWDLKITGGIHIGANEGQEAELYNELIDGTVLWVEAIPFIWEKLLSNIEKYTDQIAVCLCASDVHQEEIEFNISNNGAQSSSMLEFGLHSQLHPTVNYIDKIKLKTTRLDVFFDECIGGMPWGINFLNADVQGAELKVLKGLGKYLNQIDYLILEVNAKETYIGCPLIGELDEFLSNYKRVETGQLVGGAWSDALYIKKSLLND